MGGRSLASRIRGDSRHSWVELRSLFYLVQVAVFANAMDKVPNAYPYIVDAVIIIVLDVLVVLLIACMVSCRGGAGALQIVMWTLCEGMWALVATWPHLPVHVKNLALNVGLFFGTLEEAVQQYNQDGGAPAQSLSAAPEELKTEVSTAASNLGTNASAA